MKKKLSLWVIFTLFFIIIGQSGFCQFWHSYNPFIWFDVNSLDIPGPGVIVAGGGHETHDSIQVMFQSSDYGLTWNENAHDGLAPWNKSVAFSDSLNGYGVGDHGSIIKSNDGGLNWGWNVASIDRSFNKIFFVPPSTYYIAGGIKASDSMQTILMSPDTGHTWNVIYDALGPWLRSIYFTNSLKGFAVGDNGVILATSNGGSTWNPITAPVQRDFYAITFINADTGYIIGGTPSGQLRRTILRTINGGINWSVLLDTQGGILKDISFANGLIGYTVGDSATVLQTMDGGLNWLPIIIDTNLTGSETFNTVKFYNRIFGVIGGKAGKLYVYYNPYPLTNTMMATDISYQSAKLNGTVDAGGLPTAITFEYGTTTGYGNEIIALPDSCFSVGSINVYAVPTGLTPNTIYHFRIKAQSSEAISVSADMIFFTGHPEIPNFDFEIWDSTTVDFPDDWTQAVGNILKYSPACNGSYAIKLQNTSDGHNSAIVMGKLGEGFNGHGVPFNARPDTLTGCFNYNINATDTAWIALLLSKDGNPISKKIFTIVGNSAGNFIVHKFPIQYSTSDIPDSIILVLASSPFDNYVHSPNSWLIADNIHFTGTSINITNNDFEQWHTEQRFDLTGWNYDGHGLIPADTIKSTVFHTSDAESNIYAAKVKTTFSGNKVLQGKLTSGNDLTDKFAVNARHMSLTGYYKFFPQNNDTMTIIAILYKNGDSIGSGRFYQKDITDTYTPFILNINYFLPTVIPDSASIIVQAYKWGHPQGNSVLYIDNLNFDGFLSGIKEPELIDAGNFDFNVFPNPFNDKATVSFTMNKDENVMVRLFDLSGRQVALLANGKYTAGNHLINLSAFGLQKGFFICVVSTANKVQSKKLIIY